MSLGANKQALMGAAGAAGDGDFYSYQITKSARFDGSASYLNKTWGAEPSSTTQKTISVWLKKCFTGDVNPVMIITSIGNTGSYYFNNDDAIADNFAYYMGGGGVNGYTTERKFRDPGAWFHFVAILNSAESNDYDRLKIYINGELYPLNNGDWTFNAGYPNTSIPTLGKNGVANYISKYGTDTRYFSGYMADFIQIDGAAAISDFGETKNGVWIPKDPSGLTFGTNGFWLKFTNSSNFGEDFSGNNNDWTANSMGTDHISSDSPTFNSDSNGGNFCTVNPVFRGTNTTAASYGTISEGNLKFQYNTSSSNTDGYCACTHKVPASGKWYWEYAIIGGGGSSGYNPGFGIADPNKELYASGDGGNKGFLNSIVYDNSLNKVSKERVYVTTYDGSRGDNGDVMGIAIDMDNGAFYVSKNGTWYSSGDPTSGASRTNAGATWTPASEYTGGAVPLACAGGGNQPIIVANFGQEGTFGGTETAGGYSDTNGYGNFFSSVPSGYSAICSGALTVADAINPAETDTGYPQKQFNALLYTGDGGSSRAITGVGFQPDLIWIKRRSAAENHNMYDAVRGANKRIQPNRSVVETTEGLPAIGSDGFTVDASGGINNVSSQTYVAWNWKANGAGSSNDDGGTTSTVSANTAIGFSIVQYAGSGSGQTMGHGLDKAPEFMSCKPTAGYAYQWVGYHKNANAGATGQNGYISWETTSGFNSLSTIWNNTAPTSTVFSTGGSQNTGASGGTYINYCWHSVEGVTKVGQFIGNASTNGTFIYTGFKPAWLLMKRIDRSGDFWYIIDTKRSPINGAGKLLLNSDRDVGESGNATTDQIDILSNGWKMRTSGSGLNGSGGRFLYVAMAHNPFKFAVAK